MPVVSSPSDNEILAVPVTGGGNAPKRTTSEKNVSELKRVFDERVDMNNSEVLNKGAILAAKYSGDLTTDQVSSIYDYLKNGDGIRRGWSYVRDRRGLDYYRYANESLKLGEEVGCSGVGDCDDFAILMSALVESIGGTTRIILARNISTGGHAYTEVYLGNLDVQNNKVESIIGWLKLKLNTDKIYVHLDTDTKDVWLNLDWGPDEKGNAHPGGPFYKGDKHIVLCIRDKFEKTLLRIPEKPNMSPGAGNAISQIAGGRDTEQTRPNPLAMPKTNIDVSRPDSATRDENICTGAEMGSYAKLVFCLPPDVVVEPEAMAEANYTSGTEVAASMLLDGDRVYLHILYPCQAPQKELESAELKPYLEAYNPVLAQVTYNESVPGPALWGQTANQIFIAYQPNNQTVALVLMDINMSETMMTTFLHNLSITVNEGVTPAEATKAKSDKEKLTADMEAAKAKLEAAREKMRGF